MKDCEIFKNLKQFTDAGVQATYHSCDISDRDALAARLGRPLAAGLANPW